MSGMVLALGWKAFSAYCRVAGLKGLAFGHGVKHEIPGKVLLLASYHPIRQNTNTARLTWEMWAEIFRTARAAL